MAYVKTLEGPRGKRYKVAYKDALGRSRSQTFRTRHAADAFAREVEQAKDGGSFRDFSGGREPFQAYATRLLGDAEHPSELHELRPSTIERYRIAARLQLFPTLGAMPMGRITPEVVRSWQAALLAAGTGPATVLKARMVLSRILTQAVADGRIGANPVRLVPAPRQVHRETRFLTEAEVRSLADAIDPRYRAWLLLSAYGGLRIGETVALRWANVDVLARTVRVTQAAVELGGVVTIGETKTPASRRVVTIPGFVAEALARHREAFSPGTDDLVFAAPEGGPIRRTNFRSRVWDPACRRADVHGVSPHDLRHFAASVAIAAGAHPKTVQGRLGHSSISVTMDTYGHLFPALDAELADRLDEGWRDAPAAATVTAIRRT